MSNNQIVNRGGQWQANSLNTIRLLAALQVLYGHAITHLDFVDVPVFGEFINFFSGVPIFFTMSGFLIWWSIERSHSYGEYLKKRFWRIYPELWVAVAIELVVMLLLYHDNLNWPQVGMFAITQSTIFQFWTPDCLRGYGCGCPNGALWTICVLIQFYVFAYFFFKWLHNRKSWIWILTIVASIAISWLTPIVQSHLPEVIGKLYGQTLIPYLWMFLFASFIAEKQKQILPFIIKYWWAFVVVAIALRFVHIDIMASYSVFHTMILFCAVTGFAYTFPQLNIKTDISYGVYIYHMTVVNALIALGYMHDKWLLAIVIVLTCILAYISTKTVGDFSKKMKTKLAAQS